MGLEVVSIADRPELARTLDDFPDCWPEYMAHQRLSELFYARVVPRHPAFCHVAVDTASPDRPLAKAYSVPLAWPADPDWPLPPDGHDAVITQAVDDILSGATPTVAAAVEITVQVRARGRGLSALMLDAMRRNAARHGLPALLAPVRPTATHTRPGLPMAEYAGLTRPDGLPLDPWLRVHARAGGRLETVAPLSMTVTGTCAQWRSWTGVPFDTPGPVAVPDTLAPVTCDPTHDRAVYVEPNVWVRHTLQP